MPSSLGTSSDGGLLAALSVSDAFPSPATELRDRLLLLISVDAKSASLGSLP